MRQANHHSSTLHPSPIYAVPNPNRPEIPEAFQVQESEYLL